MPTRPFTGKLISQLRTASAACGFVAFSAWTSSVWAADPAVDPAKGPLPTVVTDDRGFADRTEALPTRLRSVDVKEHLGEKLPNSLGFTDERGTPVLYDEALDSNLPTLLTLNYSDCPMLCSLQLNGLIETMKRVDLSLGKDYRILTVSLDPQDTPEKLSRLKSRYLAQYGRAGAETGWRLLSGSENNIRAIASALGISYHYNEARDEYAHPAVVVLASPKSSKVGEGELKGVHASAQISRYLYGLEIHPDTLRLSLIEASEGKVGSSLDRLILYCFHYDATEGRYAPVAMNIMRICGAFTALALLGLLVFLFRSDRKSRSRGAGTSSSGTSPSLSSEPLRGSV